ncbi:hypothetical protein CGLO_16934 [Colletotrichum gloeosporioides Cg-14]|uniref:Uncharacterized protein n=1 Tax=Colletotrichum gloeosporioides (strain Cg-14) TaxID=1237896 RepID=T0KY09_COLGC|nr:hypothetical protein CGLO_16934 [Colletotrichum gloeosporioides Cg-14]
MSFKLNPDVGRPEDLVDYSIRVINGNPAAAHWRHAPDASSFDDGAAFRIIRAAVSEQRNDPQHLRRTAGEVAALLPAERSAEALASLWGLFISLAQQTPSGNIAMLDLVVLLDHLALSPKTAATVVVDGFEQISRLHGLDRCIRECMVSPYVSDEVTSTLTRWINLNAFAALLWSYNLVDGRDHAVQQLRSAFEDRRSSDVGDHAAADARVVAAAQWAEHACQRLYHLSVTSSGEETTGTKAKLWRPGARFKGRAGFSFQRWEFWQAAFEEAHEFGSGGAEAKVEAGAASGMMEKVLYAGFEG